MAIEEARSVNHVTSREVKDGVLCPNTVFTDVWILIHHTLLLLTQAVNHLTNAVHRLGHDDALSNLVLLIDFTNIITVAALS